MRLTQVNQKGEGGVFAFVILLNQVLRWVQPGCMRCALLGSAEPWPSWGWVQKVVLGCQRAGAWTGVSCTLFPTAFWDVCRGSGVRGTGQALQGFYIRHYTSLLNLGFPKLFWPQDLSPLWDASLHAMENIISSLSRPVGHTQWRQGRICRLLLSSTLHRVRTLFFLTGKRKHRTLAGVLSFEGISYPRPWPFKPKIAELMQG